MLAAQNNQAPAMSQLGLGQSLTPEEIALRKKKLLAAGSDGNPFAKYGDSAFALLGLRPSSP